VQKFCGPEVENCPFVRGADSDDVVWDYADELDAVVFITTTNSPDETTQNNNLYHLTQLCDGLSYYRFTIWPRRFTLLAITRGAWAVPDSQTDRARCVGVSVCACVVHV